MTLHSWVKLLWYYLLGKWYFGVILAAGINLYEWHHQTPWGIARPVGKGWGCSHWSERFHHC
jgi:hypothetical protein